MVPRLKLAITAAIVSVILTGFPGCRDWAATCKDASATVVAGDTGDIRVQCDFDDGGAWSTTTFWSKMTSLVRDNYCAFEVPDLPAGLSVSNDPCETGDGKVEFAAAPGLAPGNYSVHYTVNYNGHATEPKSIDVTVLPPSNQVRYDVSLRGLVPGTTALVAGNQVACSAPRFDTTVADGQLLEVDASGPTIASCSWACQGAGAPFTRTACVLSETITEDLTCQLSVTRTGTDPWLTLNTNGSGSIQVSKAGAPVTCNGSCEFPSGTAVDLLARPDAGSFFVGWDDACLAAASNPNARVTLSSDMTCTATFQAGTPLDVEVVGVDGMQGRVFVRNTSLSCDGTCTTSIEPGTTAVLEAQSVGDGEFNVTWGQDCQNAVGMEAEVVMDGPRRCTVTFSPVGPDCSQPGAPTIHFEISRMLPGQPATAIVPDANGDYHIREVNDVIRLDALSSMAPVGRTLAFEWGLPAGVTSVNGVFVWRTSTSLTADTRYNATLLVSDNCGQTAALPLVFITDVR